MNKYDFVPMNNRPQQFSDNTYMSEQPSLPYESKMPNRILDVLNDEISRLREQNNYNGLGFGRMVRPDAEVEKLRSDVENWYRPEAGTFSVAELNRLLSDKYNSDLYDLIMSKSRAEATQNIMNQIINATKGIY